MAGTGTVTVTILGNATHLEKTLNDVDSSLGSKLGNIGDKFSAAGRKMTMGLTLPIVGGLGLAVKAFGDFEQQLNTFKAVSGATADEMSRIAQLAKDLGKDITLPGTSAKDAADAMTELAKAGLSVEDTMAASKAVLQLSAAAQMGNAEAATLTATALNAFGLRGTDAIRVADLLAATANASSAEISDVGLAMSQASAVFSAAKIPVEDLSTAIGLMANNGIRGSDAGTSLKSGLLALQTPSNKQAGIMKEVGFSIYDASGRMKSMRDIVGNLEKSFKGMTQQQRDSNLGILFGSDAIRAGNILLKEGVAGWDELKGEVTRGGAAADVAGAKMKGVKGSIEALRSNVETLAISIGEKLAPFLSTVTGHLNSLVDWFGNLSPTVQNVALVVLGLVAALGPIIWILGAIIGAVATLQVTMTFLAANPIVLVIAAVVALVAGLIFAYTKFQAFRDVVDGVVRFLVDTVGPMVGAFKDYVVEQFANLVKWVKAFWPQVSEAIGRVFEAIKTIVGPALAAILAVWQAVGDNILNYAKTIWNFIRETIENAIQLIKGIIQTVVAMINGDWGKAWEGIKNIVGAVWDQIGNIISTAVGLVKSVVSGALDVVVLAVGNALGAIVGFFLSLPGRLVAAVGDLFGFILTLMTAAKNWVWDRLGEIVGFYMSLPGRLLGAAGDLFGFIKTKMTDAKNWVRDRIGDIVGYFVAMPGRFASGVGNIFGFISDSFRAAINFVIRKWNDLSFSIGGQEVFGVNLPGVTINTPNIPLMAAGGIVSRPTLAMLGEAGPEAVIPLSRSAGGPVGGTTVIQLVVEGKTLTEVVFDGLLEKQRRTGALGLT